MARFSYKVRDDDNRLLVGTMDGTTSEEIFDRLIQKNLVPVSVTELNFDGSKKGETFLEKLNAGYKRFQNQVPLKNVVFFTRQLATMLESGVSISEALIELAEDEKPVFRRIILQIEDDVAAGTSFSDALSRHPGVFNSMFVSVIRSGEASGALVAVLDQMAVYQENSEALRQKIKGALRYPMFICGFILLMVIGILWKLVPVFSNMYRSFGAQLPLPTQILVAVSSVIQHYFALVMLGLILIVVLIRAGLTNPSFRLFVDTYILKVPIYGLILQKNIWARFCRTLALLMRTGTPILQAIEISSGVLNNTIYTGKMEQVYEKLRAGEPLSKALRETGLFPRLVTKLTATGEKSGRIDELLVKAAEFYEREIKVTVESVASIIEPALIIVLAGVVGSILIALYLPVFKIGSLLLQ
jgi:type IV pilus assembly protein PilC